jgi:putative ABC transport system substrate-binding protein
MHRREFICGIAGAVAGAVRRIGVLMGSAESHFRAYLDAFVEELARLGWIDGRNARIDVRWTKGDISRLNAFATELVAAQPDIILCSTTAVTTALHRETTTIPIVFTIVSDPVGARLVAGLSRPGGTVTGSCTPILISAVSGSVSSNRWRPASNVPQSCSIQTPRPAVENITWGRSRVPPDR